MEVIERADVVSPSYSETVRWFQDLGAGSLLLLLRFRLYRNGAMMEQPKWGQVVIARG